MSTHESASTFGEHAQVYELLVDWPRRLSVEEPFYRRVFGQVPVRRVLDAACGTGQHAAMLHSWGLEVEGADISPGMIAQCKARFGEQPGLRWVVRAFDQPVTPPGAFDVVLCIGNSLALAADEPTIARAAHAMLRALRPGGLCIIGVLNLWSMPEGRTTWQKCKRVEYGNADHVLLKAVHRSGNRGHIDFVDLDLSRADVAPRYDSAEFIGISAEWLTQTARSAGAVAIECYGSFRFDPYDPEQSGDLLFTCRRS